MKLASLRADQASVAAEAADSTVVVVEERASSFFKGGLTGMELARSCKKEREEKSSYNEVSCQLPGLYHKSQTSSNSRLLPLEKGTTAIVLLQYVIMH